MFSCKLSHIGAEIHKLTHEPPDDRLYRDTRQVAAQNTRARKLGVDGLLDVRDWRKLLDKHGYRCVMCHSKEDLVIDHIVAISRGGINTIDNVQPLCRGCNLKKAEMNVDFRTPIAVGRNVTVSGGNIHSPQLWNVLSISEDEIEFQHGNDIIVIRRPSSDG